MNTNIELLNVKDYRIFADMSDKKTGMLKIEKGPIKFSFDFYTGLFMDESEDLTEQIRTEIRGMAMLFAKELTHAKILIQHNLTPHMISKIR